MKDNNIKKVVIFLFLVIVLIISLKSFFVTGTTVTGQFTTPQNAPNDPTGIQLQDADAGCGGDSWDTTTANLTTHMLNATLRWAEYDINNNSVYTFVCIATTRAKVDNANSTNKTSGSGCDIINFWNWSITTINGALDDNTTGVRLNNASGGSTVDYNGGKKVYYGALMAYDAQTTNNVSSKTYFNITILNYIPVVSGFNTTATHDTTPNLGWNYNDTDDGSAADRCPKDNITFSLYVGNLVSGNGTYVHELHNLTGNYTWTATALAWNSSETNDGGWANATYYYRINVTDQLTGTVSTNSDGNFQLTDNLPTKPCQWNTTSPVHEVSPNVAWGCGIETDGDTVTYSITAGTTSNGTDLVSYTTQATSNESGGFFSSSIPWNSTANLGYANTTVFMVIGAYDDASGVKTANYTISFYQYDALPDVKNVYMSDNNNLLTYTDCISSSCEFKPVSGINITLAVNITTNDTDGDCDSAGYGKTYLYLCLNRTVDQDCNDANNNYTIHVDSVTRNGNTCEWKFANNLTNITPEFFISAANYMYHINATSQSGTRSMTSDTQANGSWVYGSLQSVTFPSSITVGDASIGLGEWNPGTTVYNMSNYGNVVVYTRWNSTDFTKAGATKNWTLLGWDFLLDDDDSVTAETVGKIPYVNLTSNEGKDMYFNFSTGLELCVSKECDSVTLNETMNTTWHIYPPTGLVAGTYSSTITYTVTTS